VYFLFKLFDSSISSYKTTPSSFLTTSNFKTDYNPSHQKKNNNNNNNNIKNNKEKMQGGLELPPGFRFHPTDDELVNHYLCRKCASLPISVPIIKEIDLYKFDPWHLPGTTSF
jgi:hypothetical protein